MPSTLIEIGRSLSAAEERALMDAVHAALVEAFRIPEHDRTFASSCTRPIASSARRIGPGRSASRS